MERGTKNTILAMSLGVGLVGGVSIFTKTYIGDRINNINLILGTMNSNMENTQRNFEQANNYILETSREIGDLIDSLNKE